MEIITIQTVNAERAHTDAQLVDVREAHEVAEGVVPGSKHIALGELPERLNELDKARPVWAICRSGNRSGQAATLLAEKGFRVFNMQGGMLAWNDAGYPTERL